MTPFTLSREFGNDIAILEVFSGIWAAISVAKTDFEIKTSAKIPE